jgi:hypothetical protein
MQKKTAMCWVTWVYDEDEKLSALLSQVGSHFKNDNKKQSDK